MRRSLHAGRFQPRFLSLEARDTPAVVCIAANGVLNVIGDLGNNTIDIANTGPGMVRVVGDGAVSNFAGINGINVYGSDGNDLVRGVWDMHGSGGGGGAGRVNVNLGGGNDTLRWDLVDLSPSGIPTVGQAFSLTADGSIGNDSLAIYMHDISVRTPINIALSGGDGSDALIQDFSHNYIMSPLSVNLRGGNGDDRVDSNFDFTGSQSIYNAPVKVSASGDAGNDTVNFNLGGGPASTVQTLDGSLPPGPCKAVLNASFDVTLDGGVGNDTVAATAFVAPQGPGKLSAKGFGGAGDDDVTLDLSNVPANKLLIGLIDGGAGFDTHHSSANVFVSNCEL